MPNLTPDEEAAIERLVQHERKIKKPKPDPVEHPEPEPIDVVALLVEADRDMAPLFDIVRRRAVLTQFAKRIWAEAYNTGAADVSSCCGRTGKDTPNPFDDKEPGDD